jgi:hypothetical protein
MNAPIRWLFLLFAFDKGPRLSGPHLVALSSCLTNRVVGFSLVQVIDNRSSAQWLGGI